MDLNPPRLAKLKKRLERDPILCQRMDDQGMAEFKTMEDVGLAIEACNLWRMHISRNERVPQEVSQWIVEAETALLERLVGCGERKGQR